MAIAAGSVFEVRTAGNDTNGGGFVTGAAGVDYSQQDAKNTVGNNISTADAVAVGTAVITSATATFTSDIVGNIIYLQGGTGALAAGWYQVLVFTNSTTITVDRNVAAGTGITMNIGGALASPGGAGQPTLVIGNTIWIKAGTYTIASATPNIPTGTFSKSVGVRIEGYNATRGDLGTKPILAAGVNNPDIITVTGVACFVNNLALEGTGFTNVRGVTIRGTCANCTAVGITDLAFVESTAGSFISCLASGGTGTQFSGASSIYNCVAFNNAGRGFLISNNAVLSRCISYGNTGANGWGFDISGGEKVLLSNCVAYDNAKDGFRSNSDGHSYINCIAESNTENGFELVNVMAELFSCAAFDNTAGDFNLGTNPFVNNYDSVTGTGSFFTNAAAGDFSLNNNAGGGADARAAGIPGVLPGGLTTGFLDIGTAQHQDSGGSGGEHSAVF